MVYLLVSGSADNTVRVWARVVDDGVVDYGREHDIVYAHDDDVSVVATHGDWIFCAVGSRVFVRKPLKKLVTHIFDHVADVTSLTASQDMFVSTADVAYMYNKVAPVWETIGTTDGNIGSLECVNTLCATAT